MRASRTGTGKIVSTDFLAKEKSFVHDKDLRILTVLDEDYPAILREIYDPPPVLYIMGRGNLCTSALAIVGARRSSLYGREVAFRLGYELASRGFSVLSGFARGIDTQAHQGALRAKGTTFAVLGSGLGVIYPPENRKWMEEILERGGIISEFPHAVQPLPKHFPRRNRIISGLSLGVVVVEASVRSGSLITADYALEQGREVFAVPGPVHSHNTRGVHRLIKQGARLIEGIDDILEELSLEPEGPLSKNAQILVDLSPEEEKVVSCLGHEPKGIDQICDESNMLAQEILSILFGLEMKKMVKQIPGKYYVRPH